MVDHPEFAASAGAKVRTPIDDYVATVRALGIRLKRPVNGDSFVNAMYWQYRDAGQAPYEWPAPERLPRGQQRLAQHRPDAHQPAGAPQPGR